MSALKSYNTPFEARRTRTQRGSSRRLQHRVVVLAGSIGERRLDVIWFEIGKITQDLLVRHTLGQHAKNVRHANAQAADARPPAALARLNRDAFEKFHAPKMPGTDSKARPNTTLAAETVSQGQ